MKVANFTNALGSTEAIRDFGKGMLLLIMMLALTIPFVLKFYHYF